MFVIKVKDMHDEYVILPRLGPVADADSARNFYIASQRCTQDLSRPVNR